MESLRKDTKGQWIALSALVISLILLGLAALANQAIVAGYHSSNAALEFPKENIREMNLHTRTNAEIIRNMALDINSTSNDTVPVIFTLLFDDYSSQMEILYAAHGEAIGINLVAINVNNGTYSGTYNSSDINKIFVDMKYNDGDTIYASEPEVIEVNT